MAYDDVAKRVAIKAIGTVESNLNYRAINYNDPITVGVMQWFGTRAAGILTRMRDENPSAWAGVHPTIDAALTQHAPSSSYWPSRYLTSNEGESLRPVLNNNKAIQNDQAALDLDNYKTVAENLGMDPDGNTDAVLFFFTMYHQSPQRALNVVRNTGVTSSMNQLYQAALREPVLGRYRTRYTTARDIIASGDPSGVGELPDPDPTPIPPPKPGVTDGEDNSVQYIESQGDLLVVKLRRGGRVTAYPNGRGWWLPRTGGAGSDPGPVEPDPEPDPDPDPSNRRFVSPAAGRFTSGWGARPPLNYHYGIDVAPPTPGASGHPFYAAHGGTVRAAAISDSSSNPITGTWNSGSYLVVDNPWGETQWYGHAETHAVAAGDVVSPGQLLGTMGARGNVTGVHLHFEMWTSHSRSPIDPAIRFQRAGVAIGSAPVLG